jgi:ribosomal protein L6P/L9E
MCRKQLLRGKKGEVMGGRTRRWREKQRGERWWHRGIKVSRDRVSFGVAVEVKGRRPEDIGGFTLGGTAVMQRREHKKALEEARHLLTAVQQCGKGKVLGEEASFWEEERVRIGTGYRVKQVSGGAEGELQLDLGYGHRKYHTRPDQMGVEVFKAGRKVRWEGQGARKKVMQEVCALERRRPRSEYTGCGRTRKSRVGKKKLKPTKVRV